MVAHKVGISILVQEYRLKFNFEAGIVPISSKLPSTFLTLVSDGLNRCSFGVGYSVESRGSGIAIVDSWHDSIGETGLWEGEKSTLLYADGYMLRRGSKLE